MMTEKEAFRLGILQELASRGITPSEANEALEKEAVGPAAPLLSAATAGKILGIAPYILGVPIAGGALTGYLHAKLTESSPEDVELAKQKELIATLRAAADESKLRAQRLAFGVQPKAMENELK